MRDDELKEVGRNAQLLPAYLRVVCRSRVDYTPDEIIEMLRNDAMNRLSRWDLFNRYAFARGHYHILREYPPDRALIIINAVRPTEIGIVCPYIRSEKKTSCFVCGMVRDFVHVVTYGTSPEIAPTATGAAGGGTDKGSASQTPRIRKQAKAQAGDTNVEP